MSGYKKFYLLSTEQQEEAFALRPSWKPTDFRLFEFWVKPDDHLSRRGGHHQLTEEGFKELNLKYFGDPRVKGDLRDWKPGVIFHFGSG